ncbi:MAG: PEP-CTERM sorting domain-containing protein [Pirellulales bacterium]|nr:PEP-CTERM sorting domain-containing protein [Pirellulales bacterium]
MPSTELVVYPISDWIEVDPSGSGREGIWPLSGEIAVHLDNYPEPLEKTMWVQLTWQPQEGVGVPVLSDFDAYPTATQTPPEIVGEVDLGFGWTETTYRWTIIPNPEWESFVIGGTINVDELVIDTWCPEPSTYVLLGLGAIALGFYRWRRKRA